MTGGDGDCGGASDVIVMLLPFPRDHLVKMVL